MSNTQEYNENAIKSYENFAEDFFNNFDKYKHPQKFFLDINVEILRKRNIYIVMVISVIKVIILALIVIIKLKAKKVQNVKRK